MRLFLSLCATLFLVGSLNPAVAQYDRIEKSKAEIALEEASMRHEANRAARSEAIRACGAKDYQACFELGDLYRKGLGGAQDYDAAAKSYKKACNGRDGQGCAALAYLTTHGRGVEADLVEARRLYKKACDNGELSGCAGYGNMVYTGKGGAKSTVQGTQILQEACDGGYEWACDRIVGLGAFDADDDTWQRLKDVRNRY